MAKFLDQVHSALRRALVVAALLLPVISEAATVAGRIPATFAVSNSGAATYTIPLWTPPGVGAVQFGLALTYNSRSPNGVLGMGWSLSGLSSITRCNRTWAQDGTPGGVSLTLNDRFCLDGQQLKLVSGSNGQAGSVYATEIESFSRIDAIGSSGHGPASFQVTTKNGLIYEYGLTPDAQIRPGGGSTIRTWAVSQIRDRNGPGNRINLAYTNDVTNGSYRIASIAYPVTATGQGPFYEVLFTYVARPANDIPSSFGAGYVSREQYRLATVTIRNHNSPTHLKRYELAYGQGTATNRSRLESLQECSAVNCLPATTVAYQNGTPGWASAVPSAGVTTSTAVGVNPIPIDLNGDGLTDILLPKVATSSTSRWWAVLANLTGFGAAIDTGITTANVSLEIVGAFSGSGQQQVLMSQGGYWTALSYNPGGYFTTAATSLPVGGEYAAVDYDGDGLPDLASVVGSEIRVRRNITIPSGPITFAATAELIHTYTGAWSIAQGPTSRISMADFDGDGRGDLHFMTYMNTGFGNIYKWEILRSKGFGNAAVHTSLFGHGVPPMPGDWNADGCTDLLNGQRTYLSNCAGGFTLIQPGGSTVTQLAGDWDGDGRTDILYRNTSNNIWYVIRSTGEGFVAAISTGVAAPLGTQWFVLDQDGDGLLDAGFVDTAASNTIKYRLHNGATVSPDLAVGFTDGFGILQNPSYKTISRENYTKHSDAVFPEQDFKGPLYVVDQFVASDGSGGTYQTQFWYFGARLHTQGRGFEGFAARRSYDSRTGLFGFEYTARQFPYAGIPVQHDLYQSNLTNPIMTWAGSLAHQELGAGSYERRYFPFVASSTAREFEFGGLLNGVLVEESATSWVYADGYGNPTLVSTVVTDKDPTSPFYNSSWQSTVSSSFSNNTATNCFGLPLSSGTTRTAPGQSAQTRTYGFGVDSYNCRVTQQVIEPWIPNQKVAATLGFDACGNVSSHELVGSQPDGLPMPARLTSLNFGARCQFPESMVNALGQTAAVGYSYDFGRPIQSTDPNGLTSSWLYDDFGRVSRESRPDGTATDVARTHCETPSCWGDATLRLLVTSIRRDSANATVNTRHQYFDGLERLRSDESFRVLGV